MIKPMTKYSFVIFHKEAGEFLAKLQEIGLMDITRSTKPATAESKELFEKMQKLSEALHTLGEVDKSVKDGKLKIDKKSVLEGGVSKGSEEEQALIIASYTEELAQQKKRIEGEISTLENELKLALPWGDFNRDDIEKIKALGYTLHYYCVAEKRFEPALAEQYPLQEISRNAEKVYFVILSPKGDNSALPQRLKEIAAPTRAQSEIAGDIAQQRSELEKINSKLYSLSQKSGVITNTIDALKSRADLFLAAEGATKEAEQKLDIFEGFVPTESDSQISSFLDSYSGVLYLKQEATLQDNPPIALKNNRFTRMFALLSDMYGRPAYNEFDPTPYIAIFFMLFFAMCMGDAGYGILLIIISFLLKKAKGAAQFAPLVLTLGIATTVIGFVLHTFFGVDISQVSWMPSVAKKFMITGKIAGYDAQMLLSFAIGVFHICVAMVVKAIYSIKKNGFAASLGTLGWTLLIVGSVIAGSIALAGVMSAAVTKIVIIAIGILSAIGIFLLNDIHRNPLKNIGSGLWETYNTATGLLGDVLSYIRLYALGLAGGMLGAAFNQLGGMIIGDAEGFTIKWIFFVLVVVLGHTLNLAMCCLGAFVHPLRLNFLEFFKNSGYEGSGKTYKPLTINNNN